MGEGETDRCHFPEISRITKETLELIGSIFPPDENAKGWSGFADSIFQIILWLNKSKMVV